MTYRSLSRFRPYLGSFEGRHDKIEHLNAHSSRSCFENRSLVNTLDDMHVYADANTAVDEDCGEG